MKKDKLWVERIAEGTDLQDTPIPGLPLIELAGDRRVLMENHGGVTEYGTERICVRVKFGQVCISGEDLCLSKMSKYQLIISGRIASIELYRGCK